MLSLATSKYTTPTYPATANLVLVLDAFSYTPGSSTWTSSVGSTTVAATLNNTPMHMYNYIQFAGTLSGQGASIPYINGATAFNGTHAYTIAAWVWLGYDQRTTAGLFNGTVSIAEHFNINPTSYCLWYYTPYNSDPAYASRLGFNIINNAGTATRLLSTTTNVVERWVFVCGTANHPSQRMCLYIDGTLESEGVPPTGLNAQNWSPQIFQRGNGASKTNGRLGLFTIYNKELTATEVQALFQTHRPRFYG